MQSGLKREKNPNWKAIRIQDSYSHILLPSPSPWGHRLFPVQIFFILPSGRQFLQLLCEHRGRWAPQNPSVYMSFKTPSSLEEDFDYSAWGCIHSFPVSYCWGERSHVAQTGSQGSISGSTGLRERSVHQFSFTFPPSGQSDINTNYQAS